MMASSQTRMSVSIRIEPAPPQLWEETRGLDAEASGQQGANGATELREIRCGAGLAEH